MSGLRKKQLLAALAVIWVAMALFLLSGATELGRSRAEEANRRRLQNAVWVAQANYDGLQDVGYAGWTPTSAAQRLVTLLNAAQVTQPDELPPGMKLPPARTKYVLGKPTGPWQVALVADERRKRVRVEAYGKDLEKPIIVRELVVAGY